MDFDTARPSVYRIRTGDWRIVYPVDSHDVHVIRIIHRDEGYDWLE